MTLMSFFQWGAVALWLFWMFSGLKTWFVKGSQQRFVLSSLERLFRYPALAFPAYFLIDPFVSGIRSPLQFITAPVFLLMWYSHYRSMKRHDDDDDIWKHLKKKLKSFVQSLQLTPMPAGAGA